MKTVLSTFVLLFVLSLNSVFAATTTLATLTLKLTNSTTHRLNLTRFGSSIAGAKLINQTPPGPIQPGEQVVFHFSTTSHSQLWGALYFNVQSAVGEAEVLAVNVKDPVNIFPASYSFSAANVAAITSTVTGKLNSTQPLQLVFPEVAMTLKNTG